MRFWRGDLAPSLFMVTAATFWQRHKSGRWLRHLKTACVCILPPGQPPVSMPWQRIYCGAVDGGVERYRVGLVRHCGTSYLILPHRTRFYESHDNLNTNSTTLDTPSQRHLIFSRSSFTINSTSPQECASPPSSPLSLPLLFPPLHSKSAQRPEGGEHQC